MMSVPAVSIDDFVAAHGVAPTLVKIDVEGAELKVLHGMEGVLRAGSPVLFVEVHPDGLRALGDSSEDLLSFLFGLGYEVVEVVAHRSDAARVRRLDRSARIVANSLIQAAKPTQRP
jgi:hypothetical protein